MGAFKAYDIRGIYNKDFNKDTVYKIGFFLPKLLNAKTILVGRDDRESSPEIFNYLSKGITDAGSNVEFMGYSTTPMVYYITASHNYDASVQITASHNPKEYNGLKISKKGALPVGYESGLDKLEKMVANDHVIASKNKGSIKEINVNQEYINFLKGYINDLSNLKMGIDCSNGMASILIKDLLGDQPTYLFDKLDGTFPNHEPNPLEVENCKDLINLVNNEKLDIGVIFDGDADRVMFIDEKGRFVSPDLIIAVMGHYFLNNKKGNVLHDIRTSKAVTEYLEKMGADVHMWKVGHAYAKIKLREINAIFGGELAGHYYFKDFYNCDSGILAGLIVLDVVAELKKQGKKFSELIDEINIYKFSGEMNFKIEEKQKAMDYLKDELSKEETPVASYDFDGYRVEFDKWWFNVRPSNTEPYLRVVAEANNDKILKQKVDKIKNLLKSFE